MSHFKKTVLPEVFLFLVLSSSAYAKTIHVGNGDPADSDNIQAGIDVADDGDTVLVATGEYVITEPIVFRGKAISVKSKVGPTETTIRMGTPSNSNRGSVVGFENNETATSILQGFTITGGRGCRRSDPYPPTNRWAGLAGGGILCWEASPTIVACTITQNTADHGGGILCLNSDATLTDCIVQNCSAKDSGGGVTGASRSSLTLANCVIRDNSAPGAAGGVFSWDNSCVTMTGCTVAENSAGQAGGGVLSGGNAASAIITHCVIIGNTAGLGGGGVEAWQQGSVTVINCVIAQNTAFAWGGGGVICSPYGYPGCSATVSNSILWGNAAPEGGEIWVRSGAEFGISYSNIAGGQTGISVEGGCTLHWDASNINADPYFTDPANDNYYLRSEAGRWNPSSQTWVQDNVTSPCIDAGGPNSPVAFEPCPNGGIVNMGAYGGTAEASKSPSGLHAQYGGGTGEPNDPYLLYTAEHLNALGAEPNDYNRHFKLMADIDLSEYTYDRAVIAPDINDGNWDFDGTSFTGGFNGQGHNLAHLAIGGDAYLGLFGQLGASALVSNLNLEMVDINGTSVSIGSLVGENEGCIVASTSSGRIHGRNQVGGLVGINLKGHVTQSGSICEVSGNEVVGGLVGSHCEGGITGSHSHGSVIGYTDVGGLVGWIINEGQISTSFSTSTVQGEAFVGGLAGSLWEEGHIQNSFSSGAVQGQSFVGGLVGYRHRGSVKASFWDKETSGQSSSDGGTGLATTEMQTASTFLNAGWDFINETKNGTEDIWKIVEGLDYPHLWWEEFDGRVTLELGQVLTVPLESNPSSGYRWEWVENQGSILEQLGEAEFKQSEIGDSPLVGGGGWEIFRFTATSAGQMSLKLVYSRPWEDGVEPLKTLLLQVTVGKSTGGMYLGTGSDLEEGSFWAGLIDDVWIYDRVVTP